IFQPGRGNLWVTAGPRSNGHQNEFRELKLSELLPELASLSNGKSEAANGAARQEPSFTSTVSSAELLTSYENAEAAASKRSEVCQRFVMRMVETQPLTAE